MYLQEGNGWLVFLLSFCLRDTLSSLMGFVILHSYPIDLNLTIQFGRFGAVPFCKKMIKTNSENIVNFIRKINSCNKEVNRY